MSKAWQFLMQHQTIVSLVAYYVGSAFVGALPMPGDKDGKFYHFFFVFTNTLAANLSRVSSHLQQDKAFVSAASNPPPSPPQKPS